MAAALAGRFSHVADSLNTVVNTRTRRVLWDSRLRGDKLRSVV